MKCFALFLIALLLFMSCADAEKEPYALPENPASLLAGNKLKTWKLAKRTNGKTRVNMAGCALSFRINFARNQNVWDNALANIDCLPHLKGTWNFSFDKTKNPYLTITGDEIGQIFGLEKGKKTKFFQIVELSDTLLVYRYNHALYNDSKTIIEDVLVPEDFDFKNRNFHY